jgi:hypothetical protein
MMAAAVTASLQLRRRAVTEVNICLEQSSGSASTHAPQRNWRRVFAVQNSGLVGIAACRWFDEAAQDRCKQFTDEMNRVEAEPSHLVVLIRHLATNYVTDCWPTNNERESTALVVWTS